MGINKFFPIFDVTRSPVKLKQLKNKKIAVDIMGQIYKSIKAMSPTRALKNSAGLHTTHINTVMSMLVEFELNSIDIICVFDHDYNREKNEAFHNPDKQKEIVRRRAIRESSAIEAADIKNMLDKIKKKQTQNGVLTEEDKKSEYNSLFPSDDNIVETKVNIEETPPEFTSDEKKHMEDRLMKLETRLTVVHEYMINDIKFMLRCFNVPFIEAPRGYEAEHICAMLNDGGFVDGVWSDDSDSLVFGAKVLYRPVKEKTPSGKSIKKVYYVYEQHKILVHLQTKLGMEKIPDLTDLIKLCVMLGGDYCQGTKGAGEIRVFNMFKTAVLSEEQEKAMIAYKKEVDIKEVSSLIQEDCFIISSKSNNRQFRGDIKLTQFMDWITDQKQFNRDRVKKLLSKVIDVSSLDETGVDDDN